MEWRTFSVRIFPVKTKNKKWVDNFLDSNAASNIKKTRFYQHFFLTVLNMVWFRIRNRHRNFSKVITGTGISSFGSATLLQQMPKSQNRFLFSVASPVWSVDKVKKAKYGGRNPKGGSIHHPWNGANSFLPARDGILESHFFEVSGQTWDFVWFPSLIFPFYKMLFMNRLEFSCFADFFLVMIFKTREDYGLL